MNHSALRRYYMARNGMYLCKRSLKRTPAVLALNIITALQIIQVILFETEKIKKLSGIGYGLIDGLLGRLGPLEKTRAKLARRLNG
jgi:rhamnosyltransferase